MTYTQRNVSKSATLLNFENRLSERREQWLQRRSLHQLSSSSLNGFTDSSFLESAEDIEIAECLESVIDEARVACETVSVIRVRIDQSQEISSTYGTDCYQHLQNELYQSLFSVLNHAGVAAYLSDGDLLIPDQGGSVEEKARLGERLRRQIEKSSWTADGIVFDITASIALVHMSAANATAPLLLKRSATAILQAVELGANRLEVYGSWFAVA